MDFLKAVEVDPDEQFLHICRFGKIVQTTNINPIEVSRDGSVQLLIIVTPRHLRVGGYRIADKSICRVLSMRKSKKILLLKVAQKPSHNFRLNRTSEWVNNALAGKLEFVP